METRLETITPQKAMEYLDRNKLNRNVNMHTVAAYARDMAEGRWSLTHQGISFDNDGNLTDGQHRLLACVKAGVPFETLVSYGVEISANIDRGKVRSVSDCMVTGKIVEKGNPLTNHNIIATARYSMTFPKRAKHAITASEIIEYMRQHDGSLEFVYKTMNSVVAMKGCRSAPPLYAMMCAYEAGVDPMVISEWYTVLNTGMYDETIMRSKAAAKCIMYLRNYFTKNAGLVSVNEETMLETVKRCEASLDYYDRGEVFKVLHGELRYRNPNKGEENG